MDSGEEHLSRRTKEIRNPKECRMTKVEESWASITWACGCRISGFFGHSSSASLVHVSHRRLNDFIRRGQTGLGLANAVLAQGAHAHFARASAQDRRRHFFIDQLAGFVINDENLEDAETPP